MANRNWGRSGQMAGYGAYASGGAGVYGVYGGSGVSEKRSYGQVSKAYPSYGGSYGGNEGFYKQRSSRDNVRGGGSRGGPVSRSPPGDRGHRREESYSSRRSGGGYSGGRRYGASVTGKYEVKVPRVLFDLKEASVAHLKNRYARMYVPSDFFHADLRWQDVFSLHSAMKLGYHADFQVFHKEVEPVIPIDRESSSSDPPDADYTFSAKVMLLASPNLADLYKKSCRNADESHTAASEKVSAPRLIHFLVGTRGKSEPMAIGGPWSPSLDGPNPDEDPQVLINTAIRTCKALTGIDLTPCTQWFRFLELHYFRPPERSSSTPADTPATGKAHEPRVETVVIFMPDVWSCMPDEEAWTAQKQAYSEALDKRLNPPEPEPQVELLEAEPEPATEDVSASQTTDTSMNQEEDEEGGAEGSVEGDPTHYAQLDPKSMKVADLRRELTLRKLNSKGLKAQLTARLQKAMDEEEEVEKKEKATKEAVAKQEGKGSPEKTEGEKPAASGDEKVEESVTEELTEKDRRRLERAYRMCDGPAIIVHPSPDARGGRFECHKHSLSTLIDYRPDDQKEHTFEVSLFAEQFNEMLQRDAAFSIYKAIVVAPEPEKKEAAKEKTEDESKEETEPDNKRRRKDSQADEDDDAEETEEEKAVRKIRRTVDMPLLFSFTYWDSGHAEYILERDLEDMIQALGLNLSRAQVRKMINKVTSKKDLVHYRTLTDKDVPEGDDEDVTTLRTELDDDDYIVELAQGNKALFDEEIKTMPAKTIIGGSQKTADLLSKLEKSEEVRISVQLQFEQLKAELEKTRANYNTSRDIEAKLSEDLQSHKEKLRAERRLVSESRQLSGTYNRLLRFSEENLDRVVKEIGKQFEKEKREKEAEKEAKRLAEAKEKEEAEAKLKKESGEEAMEQDGVAADAPNGKAEDEEADKKPAEDKSEWEVVDEVV